VGVPAAGDGLWLGCDVLAALARVAGGRDWQRLHELLLTKLNQVELIDWSRAVIDSSHVRAFGGRTTGPTPVDRSRRGPKHHLIACGRGSPLTVGLTGGNPQRHHRGDPVGRCDPAGAGPPRATAPSAKTAPRRPRLPLGRGPLRAAPPPHPGEDRRSQNAARLRARQAALCRRAHDRLAAPVPPPARPL
jgi:hypothetical protein